MKFRNRVIIEVILTKKESEAFKTLFGNLPLEDEILISVDSFIKAVQTTFAYLSLNNDDNLSENDIQNTIIIDNVVDQIEELDSILEIKATHIKFILTDNF